MAVGPEWPAGGVRGALYSVACTRNGGAPLATSPRDRPSHDRVMLIQTVACLVLGFAPQTPPKF